MAGRIADINLLADMRQPMPQMVVCRGRLAARDGALVMPAPSALFPWDATYAGSEPEIPQWGPERFVLPSDAPNPFPAGRIVSAAITREVSTPLRPCAGGLWPSEGLVLAASNRGGKWISRGVAHSFGEEVDALATTYTANAGILVLGRTPQAMAEALARLGSMKGGVTVRSRAGLWSDFPLDMAGVHGREGFDEAARWARDFESAFRASGYNHSDPKYTLLFLTCDILPEVRATEAGWIRVKTGELLYAAQRLACE